MQEAGAATVLPRAVFCDLAMAVLLTLLTTLFRRIHILLAAVFIILAGIYHIASTEMAAALNTFINVADLHYAADGQFMKYALSCLTFPRYTILFMSSIILYLVALYRAGKNKLIRLAYVVIFVFISISGLYILSPKGREWQSSNLLWLSFTRSIARPIHATESHVPINTDADGPEQLKRGAPIEGVPYFRKPPDAARNVLIVVLEGIPGVYVEQVQECTGVSFPVKMMSLNRIAEKSLVVPNFLAHNRQTMRGLYSLLSGDYCKLSTTTPKIYEYVKLSPESRNPCIPEILAGAGYTTVYLQAADLSFMSKNLFMPKSGFERVLGKEYFQYQYVHSGWGPDDKAFFEQAAACIEDLNKHSKPWFLTLLTVGTHHPYTIPDEFEEEFSSRKLAAVAYLDEALDDFFKRLGENGTLNDTLLLITSDESHGVQGQPYGNYWGLSVAHSPESFAVINRSVFGLIDIPYSILDYLGLTDLPHSFPKQSIFRDLTSERTILFGPHFCSRKGVVKKRINRNCVKIYRSANGELFSSEYSTMIVKNDEGRKLSEELLWYQTSADSSLFQSTRKDRNYVLLEDESYIIGSRESRLLSSGQYLDIPGASTVTVELEVTAELVGGPDNRGSNACVRLVLQMLESYEKMPIPEIKIPVLRDGDSLRLSFSFHTEEPLTRVWAYLRAISVNPVQATKLTVKQYSVKSNECESKHDFRIDQFSIQKRGAANLQPKQENATQSLQPHRSSGNADSEHAEDYDCPPKGINPHIVELESDGHAYTIDFAVNEVDERYDHYTLLIHFTHRSSRMPHGSPSLNDHNIAYTWLHQGMYDIEIMLYFERTVLNDNSVNTVSLPCHGGSMDVELIRFTLLPCLPPIAHAGGAYRGLTYTNSVEALEENADSFHLFEIDLSWSEDNQLVGLHDWGNTFSKFFGFTVEEPMDYAAFLELRTAPGFTPLDLASIREFLSRNPSARIVTDVKSDNIKALRKIAELFPDFTDRFIPQVYGYKEFVKAMEVGYRDIIWTLYRDPHIYEPSKIKSCIYYWEDEYAMKPFAVALPVAAVERGVAKHLSEAGIPVYVHTINTCDAYKRLIRLGVSSIYTDYLDVTECFNFNPS